MDINEYADLLKEAARFKQTGKYEWEALFLTGSFKGCHDYNAGVLSVKIIQLNPAAPEAYRHGSILISSIDDSAWRAVGKIGKEIDVECIISSFASYGCTLPTEEELNNSIFWYGMYGTIN
jgi:hypothetical protein